MWTTISRDDTLHAILRAFLISAAILYPQYHTTYRARRFSSSERCLNYHRTTLWPTVSSWFLAFHSTFKPSVTTHCHSLILQIAFGAVIWHDRFESIRHRPSSFNYKPYKLVADKKFAGTTESAACAVSVPTINASATDCSLTRNCAANRELKSNLFKYFISTLQFNNYHH